MKRSLYLASMILLLILCAAAPVFSAEGSNAQPSQYTLGDQTLSINVGLFVPLFLLPMQPPYTATALLAGSPPQLSLGAVGSLCWAAYVAPQVRLGVELAGNFTLSPNANTLLMLPIMGKASYVFTFYPFEIPLSFAAGMNVVKYIDQYTIDLLLRPGASFYWIYNSSWSFGLNLNYWFDMQFDTTDSTQSRIGNFLEISLSALYHY